MISWQQSAIQTVSRFGIILNPTIKQAIDSTIRQLNSAALNRILNAAQVAGNAPPTRKNGQKTNREALFMQALNKGWKPRPSASQSVETVLSQPEPLPASEAYRSPLPVQHKLTQEQKDWLDLACQVGLVLGSTIENGELILFTSSNQEPWTMMVKLHPLAELREMAELRQRSQPPPPTPQSLMC